MIDRIKALKKLDRKRLDATLMRIHARPALMVAFNLVLLTINSLGRAKGGAKIVLGKIGLLNVNPDSAADKSQLFTAAFENRRFARKLSVLVVCETSIEQCLRYRVKQKLEQLTFLGLRSHWIDWTNYMEVSNQINFFDVIIFYRVPGYPRMMENIEYARQLGKIVIYDTDDLIFDRQKLESYYKKSTGQLSKKQLKGLFKGADLYKKAIRQCQFAMTTTPLLQDSLEDVVGKGSVFILPNGVDKILQTAVDTIDVVKDSARIKLFYGSGTKTHDQDFDLISSALDNILKKYNHVDLVIVGYLSLPQRLVSHSERILQIDFLQVQDYFNLLAHADINLAPLAAGFFADCKSEIKWIEAGAFSIPTITSATQVYQSVINHGENGMIAKTADDWQQAIETLVGDESYRKDLGSNALKSVRNNYSTRKLANSFQIILDQIKSKHLKRSGFTEYCDKKKHIIIVNVLYPPQAMGGATVIAQNIVETLATCYNDQYHVSVFTCDVNNIYAYQVKEYEYNGVSVTAASVPVGPDVDLRGYDSQVEEIFTNFLMYRNPDLIHFHSIQRLTASMLQAALNQDIPYVVTVHDAWWLSDHQFLVDSNGVMVHPLQSNPIIAAQTSAQVGRTISRSQQLKSLLNSAARVLAVSQYQAEFYRQNGVNNVVVNTNGVNCPDMSANKKHSSNEVVLGYSGSICHHKGYYFLKDIIENTVLDNIELKVIQFDLKEPRSEQWNQTRVEFLPKFDSAEMADFYQHIDVLIAPSMWPESFGLITREAALAGLWVIACDAGGLAEHLDHGKNGFKYELGNASQLKEILVNINKNSARFKQSVPEHDRNTTSINSVSQHIADLVQHYKQILSSTAS